MNNVLTVATIVAAFIFGVVIMEGAYHIGKSSTTAVIRAIDGSGNEYILGVGDDCKAAWQEHGPIPRDAVVVTCVETTN